MLKTCKECNTELGKDRKTGFFWCPKCKEVRKECDFKYKIAILGKNTGKDAGKNNFIKQLGKQFEEMGHKVIEVRFAEVYDHLETWDMTDCFVSKKKIPLNFIDHIYSPDIIMVEQLYYRFDISDIEATVIYQHREYTHFPDIEKPDMLFGSYGNRLHVFEYYYPNQFHNIPYTANNYVAVDPEMFNPNREKILKGVIFPTWALRPEEFANANGIIATMIIQDQVAFYQECANKGYLKVIKGGKFQRYKDLIETSEATMIDGGYINGFGRRLFEAMASKTLCFVRVHSNFTKAVFKYMGLTEDMCYFIYNPDDMKHIIDNWEDNKEERMKKVEKAYRWVLDNHTYKNRAEDTLRMYEEYHRGKRTMVRTMGHALHDDIQIDGGKIIHREII